MNFLTEAEQKKNRTVKTVLQKLQELSALAMLEEQRAITDLTKIYALLSSVYRITELQQEQKQKPEQKKLLTDEQAELQLVLEDIKHHLEHKNEDLAFHIQTAEDHLRTWLKISDKLLRANLGTEKAA